jgi:hypothetical protein
MNLKVGDPVIVYKPIWMNNTSKQGYINEIFEVDSKTVYRVYFYSEGGSWTCGCNIFTYQGETIKLNIEEARDLKLKDLGI